MLTVLLNWVLISYTLIGLGNILIDIYNAVCKRVEKYSILNSWIIGLSFLVLILSLLRFFIPINLYVFLALLILTTLYWATHKQRFVETVTTLVKGCNSFSKIEIGFIIFFLLFFSYKCAVGFFNYDAACYHLQATKWIENYPLIPGIANVEERLGFNSTFHLLSAPFTFSSFFGDPIFMIHSLFITIFMIWCLYKLKESHYGFGYILVLLLIFYFVWNFYAYFFASNTDILPNLIVFYLIVYFARKTDQFAENSLLFVFASITLITMKLSFSVFALFSCYILLRLYKQKGYKALCFLLAIGSLTIVLWMISNVYISGYLVYPLVELDLFSVDWKLPKAIGEHEREFIHGGAVWQALYVLKGAKLYFQTFSSEYFMRASLIAVNTLICIGIPALFYKRLQKRIKNPYFFFYLTVLCNLFLNYKMAPDIRFTFGFLCGALILSGFAFFDFSKKTIPVNRYFCNALLIFAMCYAIVGYKLIIDIQKIDNYVFLRPRTNKEIMHETEELFKYSTISLNQHITLIISEHPGGYTMYNAPCVPNDPKLQNQWRFQNFLDLEPRGETIYSGFRTKK